MPLFMWDGPPIYSAGQGASGVINEVIPNFVDALAATATQATTTVTWQAVPDILFTQGVPQNYSVIPLVSNTASLPMRIQLIAGVLPSGVAYNEGAQQFEYNGLGSPGTTAGFQLRASTGEIGMIGEVFANFTDAMTGTATQATGNVTGTISDIVPNFVDGLAATATQNPPPSGVRYPNRDFTPSYTEYAFSDVDDPNGLHDLGAYWFHTFQLSTAPLLSTGVVPYTAITGSPSPSPGFWSHEPNAPIQFKNKGGDWADAIGTLQGTIPFANTTVTSIATGTDVTATFSAGPTTHSLFELVQGWLSGTYPNAGLLMKGTNTNTIQWRSRWYTTDTTKLPILRLTSTSLGTVDVPCRRNIWLSSGSGTPLAGNVQFQTSGASSYGLLWFDLSSYTAADITNAQLICTLYGFGTNVSQTVQIYRLLNPADQTGNGDATKSMATLSPITYGIAANYPNDVGLENDPSVLFHVKVPSTMAQMDTNWLCGLNGSAGYQTSTYSSATVVTAPDTNGFTPLAGLYNAIYAETAPQNPVIGNNSSLEAKWSPWRGTGQQRLPGKAYPTNPPEELFIRYYLMFGLNWDPSPDGGKFPGFDGRFTDLRTPDVLQLPGMGRGNSGSGTDGITGWSARGNYGRFKTAAQYATAYGQGPMLDDDPLHPARGLGSGDMYHADMTNTFGGDFGWDKFYLGTMRKGEWNCIDLHCKLNSVTDPNEIPTQLLSITNDLNSSTSSATDGTASCVAAAPITNANYLVGAVVNVAGVATFPTPTYHGIQGEHFITSITDSTHFQIGGIASAWLGLTGTATITPGAGPDSTRPDYLSISFSRGNFDGVIEGWVNGRLAGHFNTIRFRHVAKMFNGLTFGIDAIWWCVFQGGGARPGPAGWPPYGCYLSNLTVATNYIGPFVTP